MYFSLEVKLKGLKLTESIESFTLNSYCLRETQDSFLVKSSEPLYLYLFFVEVLVV